MFTGREGLSALAEPTPVGIVADARPLTRSIILENPRMPLIFLKIINDGLSRRLLSQINASRRGPLRS